MDLIDFCTFTVVRNVTENGPAADYIQANGWNKRKTTRTIKLNTHPTKEFKLCASWGKSTSRAQQQVQTCRSNV